MLIFSISSLVFSIPFSWIGLEDVGAGETGSGGGRYDS